jgi:hypothetical protein
MAGQWEREFEGPPAITPEFFRHDLPAALAEIETRAIGAQLRSAGSSLSVPTNPLSDAMLPTRPRSRSGSRGGSVSSTAGLDAAWRPPKRTGGGRANIEVTDEDRLAASAAFEQLFGGLEDANDGDASRQEGKTDVNSSIQAAALNWRNSGSSAATPGPIGKTNSDAGAASLGGSTSAPSQPAAKVSYPASPQLAAASPQLTTTSLQPEAPVANAPPRDDISALAAKVASSVSGVLPPLDPADDLVNSAAADDASSPPVQRCPRSARTHHFFPDADKFFESAASQAVSSDTHGTTYMSLGEQPLEVKAVESESRPDSLPLQTALATLQKESRELGKSIGIWAELNAGNGERLASQPGRSLSVEAMCGRSISPQEAARLLQTETRKMDTLIKTSDLLSPEINYISLAEAAQASSGSLRLLHTSSIPSQSVSMPPQRNESSFELAQIAEEPTLEALVTTQGDVAELPLLAQMLPSPACSSSGQLVQMSPAMQPMSASQQSSVSIGSRAVDIRLQSPISANTQLGAAASLANFATPDIGRLATSALVAGRDVAPLGTLVTTSAPPAMYQGVRPQPVLQAQPPKQHASVTTQANVQYTLAATPSGAEFLMPVSLSSPSQPPPGSPPRLAGNSIGAQSSSPPHSLSPPVRLVQQTDPQLQLPARTVSPCPQRGGLVSGLSASQVYASQFAHASIPTAAAYAVEYSATLQPPLPWQDYLPQASGTTTVASGSRSSPVMRVEARRGSLFNKIDANQDGVITRAEFSEAQRRGLLPQEAAASSIDPQQIAIAEAEPAQVIMAESAPMVADLQPIVQLPVVQAAMPAAAQLPMGSPPIGMTIEMPSPMQMYWPDAVMAQAY